MRSTGRFHFLAVHGFDDHLVRRTDAERESTLARLLGAAGQLCHGDRVTTDDRYDRGAQFELAGIAGHNGKGDQRIDPGRVGQPVAVEAGLAA